MWDRARVSSGRGSARRGRRPSVEALEGRQLLAASLAPIGTVTVPTTLGFQVPLNGSASGATSQTFAVTSSNPAIQATVAHGQFLTFNISHTAANASDVSFAGPLTFQLFDDLTPLTSSRIEQFTTSGFYNSKTFHRIAPGFPTASDFIIQGGSANGFGTGSSGQPGTPFVDEFVQQLAFTGNLQLAMANSGPDTNDTQFFITTGSPRFLDFKHTVFAQLVADPNNIVPQMTKVLLTKNPQVALGNPNAPNDFPVQPIRINNASLSTTNPNGVIHVDATHANPGETSTINVTAIDPATNTTATQSFAVNVVANTQNERAFIQQLPYPTQVVTTTPGTAAQPAVVYVQNVAVNQKDIFRIPAVDPEGDKLTYTVQGGITTNPSTGAQTFTAIPSTQATATVDQNTGVVTVTPAQGFTGPINLLVGVRDQTQRVNGSTNADDPGNFSYHQIILNVSGTTPVALTPIALPVSATAMANTPTTIQLQGQSANPATSTGLTFNLVSQPTNGTITDFNPATGTLVFTAKSNFQGIDSFQYTVTDKGTGSTSLTSPPATVNVTIAFQATGTVRQIGRVLVVTPAPRTDGGVNVIDINQVNLQTDNGQIIQVVINGIIDATQPAVTDLDRIVVFGGKAKDRVRVDQSVDDSLRVTLDGGHGGRNVLQAGGGSTREHGWFGYNKLFGGTGPNQLIGRKGRVIFRPTATTTEIFAGQGHPPQHENRITPPSGTFYRFKNGRLVPIPTPPARRWRTLGPGSV